ncbi:MAG: hypothetical protein GQ535_14220 [Rhodobacteraceae bacterium]|nr:hypothetical protein [Paracoccaceae bacterium]
MNIKEYVTKQLGRTNGKRYEAYVVHRIISKLDDLSIKFVTQQYVSTKEGKYALTDLYFPQLRIHIEVDEGHHRRHENIRADKIRSRDIVNRSGSRPVVRIDVETLSIDEINSEIDKIVNLVQEARNNEIDFKPWDISTEYNSETYRKMGSIDANEDVALRKSVEVCHCFGLNYKGWQRGGAPHPEENTGLWFPRLYENSSWDNGITNDELTIFEKSKDPSRAEKMLSGFLAKEAAKRVVFARVKDNLGSVMYRFRGVYKFNPEESRDSGALVWKRVSTKTKTYPLPE